MALTPLEMVNGTLSLLCVSISTVIGLIIISKYPKYKQKDLLLVGFTWIGVFSPWWPSATSFVLALITGSGLTPTLYFLIGFIISPVVLVIWMWVFTDLKFKNQQKIIVGIYAIIGIAFEFYLIYYLFIINDPSVIGELTGVLDTTYRGIAIYYSMFIVATMLITGILFGRESLKSDNPEIKLKGTLLIIAFVSWVVGAIMDAALPLNIITLTIARLILIFSAIIFYCGFLLPDFVKKVFLKET
jgi:hypothetical protein